MCGTHRWGCVVTMVTWACEDHLVLVSLSAFPENAIKCLFITCQVILLTDRQTHGGGGNDCTRRQTNAEEETSSVHVHQHLISCQMMSGVQTHLDVGARQWLRVFNLLTPECPEVRDIQQQSGERFQSWSAVKKSSSATRLNTNQLPSAQRQPAAR